MLQIETSYIFYYLLIINVISAVLFALDKLFAKKEWKRVPESVFHFMELLGGVFINIILMYTIKHKNRKVGYSIWIWLILIAWIFFIYIAIKYLLV
ncbi:MAG: DUF1294 domain-containing protein [Paludibacter sp.]|nr:DUF1294 domain-containing protein [Paludibacter sp.]